MYKTFVLYYTFVLYLNNQNQLIMKKSNETLKFMKTNQDKLVNTTENKTTTWLNSLQNRISIDAKLAIHGISLAFYCRSDIHDRINSKCEL